MTTRINFTKRALEALPAAPAGKRVYFNDTKVSGLQLAITSSGTKTFVLYRKIAGKPTRVTLGRCPDLTPEQARKRAESVRGHIAMGGNPTLEKRAEQARAVTLADAFDTFTKGRTLKAKTVYDYGRIMKVAFPDWHPKQLVDISKDKVTHRFDRLTREHGEAYANLAMRCFRSVWNFASARYEDADGNSLLPVNPVERLSKTRAWHQIKTRKSVIKPHQLPDWFGAVMALKNEPIGSQASLVADYLLLVLFTGLRRQEAARLTWAQIDLQGKTLTVRDTKNREDHVLPLSDFIHDLLDRRHLSGLARQGREEGHQAVRQGARQASRQGPGQAQAKRRTNRKEDQFKLGASEMQANFDHAQGRTPLEMASKYVFPGEGRSGHLAEPRPQMRKVTEASGVEFTLHDLRRTFITVAESLDIPAYALKRLLNHKMANDVTAGYIVSDVERLRLPMQKITDYLLSVAGIKPKAQIIDLAGGAV